MKKKTAVLLAIIMTAAMTAGCGNTSGGSTAPETAQPATQTPEPAETPSVAEQNQMTYESIIESLSDDAWYAFADMDKDHDALLVTKSDVVFNNGDGTMAATEATVYGYDKDGGIKEYGQVAGGGTATPLAAKDSILFCGGHNYMNKIHIDEASSEMITEEGEFFDEYDDAIVIAFTPKAPASAAADLQAPYFAKGVYMYYPADEADPAKDDFYIFQAEDYGHTDNGTTGMGLPFSCVQADGEVRFTFGGEGEAEDVFTVESVENRVVTGAFANGKKLVFTPMDDVDADSFDAENYMRAAAGEDLVYNHANGWSVMYDPSCIEVNGGGPVTTFVYTGECAGSCVITVTYDIGKDAKTAIEDRAKELGEKAAISQRPFPVTSDKDAYWVDADPTAQGPGMYETAVAIDHMDGYLMLDIVNHVGGDDAIDIPVSDAFEEIINTFTIKQ